MDDYKEVCDTLVQIARFVVNGKMGDAVKYLQRRVYSNRGLKSLVWLELRRLLVGVVAEDGIKSSNGVIREVSMESEAKLLVDGAGLLLMEAPPVKLDVDPVYPDKVMRTLAMIVEETKRADEIREAGMRTSNKFLFWGSPGVGKTLAARWLANRLNLPLYTLNLATVMSSYLGKTGNNIRQVFEFVSNNRCVLLLDEFDAIAKTRSDETDIGELKRLVTVILQAIDNFTDNSVLVAATNYSETLDLAVWRRFDETIEFPLPDTALVLEALRRNFGNDTAAAERYLPALADALAEKAFSEIKRVVMHIRKAALIGNVDLGAKIVEWLLSHVNALKRPARKRIALRLLDVGYSQREANAMTGVSRDTLRKALKGG